MNLYRNLHAKIKRALERSPVILITGARQTGKTTLARQLLENTKYSYINFDDPRNLSAANSNPIGFLEDLSKPTILDEVQRVPKLFLSIKFYVDQHHIPGSFILTGSANPLLIPRLGDSLAGRMEIFYLYPFSQGELHKRQETFLEALLSANIASMSPAAISKDALFNLMWRGGYPPIQNFDAEGTDSWFTSYLATVLQRDVRDLAQIEGISQLPNLLEILATRAGGLLNAADISRSASMPNTTINRYINLLKTLYLVNFLQPWSSKRSKRLVKSSKTYLVDTGLLVYLLKIDPNGLKVDSTARGSIVENFVVMELLKQTSWHTKRTQLFHYRTLTGLETDLVLEDSSGNAACIEIKSRETVTSNDFKGIKLVKEELGEKCKAGVVLYTGTEKIPFGHNLWALPISCLWT